MSLSGGLSFRPTGGETIADGFLRVADPLSATPQQVEDKSGIFSQLFLSTTNVGVGAGANAADRFAILTFGSGAGSNGLNIVNTLGAQLLAVRDDGRVTFNGGSFMNVTATSFNFFRSTGINIYSLSFDQFTGPGFQFQNFGTRNMSPTAPNDSIMDLGVAATQRFRNLFLSGELNTGAPSGAGAVAVPWKLGGVNATVHGGVDPNNYVDVDINGVAVRLAIVL